MTNTKFVECREVFNLVNYTVTLYGPDGAVLRHDQYTKETFPVVVMNRGSAETIEHTYSVPEHNPKLTKRMKDGQ